MIPVVARTIRTSLSELRQQLSQTMRGVSAGLDILKARLSEADIL